MGGLVALPLDQWRRRAQRHAYVLQPLLLLLLRRATLLLFCFLLTRGETGRRGVDVGKARRGVAWRAWRGKRSHSRHSLLFLLLFQY